MLREVYRKIRETVRDRRNEILRSRIKNKNPSIICCNCIAGVMYHDLGMPFYSPTINLYMHPDDYIKFLTDIKYYTSIEVIESEETGMDEGREFPIGLLGDIKVYFMHYRSFEEAKEKWIERCKRINWDNLFVIMVQRDGDNCRKDHIEAFDRLPFKNKIIFVNRSMVNIKSSVYIEGFEELDGVGNLISYKKPELLAKRYYEDFDYVSWINDGRA